MVAINLLSAERARKAAHSQYMAEWRARPANAEKHRLWSKRWANDNVDKVRALARDSSARRRLMNPQRAREEKRAYYAINKDTVNASKRAWRAANPDLGDTWTSDLLSNCRALAKKRGHVASALMREDLIALWRLQDGKCCWTGLPMTTLKRSPWKVSVDRIDNKLGYSRDNVRLSSWWANHARGAMDASVFATVLAQVRGTK